MKQKQKATKRNHSLISAIIVTLVLLIGLSLLLYPTVADYLNSLNFKKDIETYQTEVRQLDDTKRQELLAAARDYNTRRLALSKRVIALNSEQLKEYSGLVNPLGTGIMGYIEIKKAQIYLPIYHGTDENVLQAGIGHIEGSSLPVGGIGTHSILSGHTGLPSSKLFSNIDKLKVGDTFELHILGETLTYQVESTVVLLPEEAEKQQIDPDRDLCTLMTCTPYGINSHRLLVTGSRIETPQQQQPNGTGPDDEPIPTPVPPVLWIAGAALLILLIAAVIFATRKRKRQPRRGDANETKG